MSKWVGIEMSDHLSSLKPAKQKPKNHRAKALKRRRTASASRRRNRS